MNNNKDKWNVKQLFTFLQLISSEVSIINNTEIWGQDNIIDSFVGNVNIENLHLHNGSSTRSFFIMTSSTLNFVNVSLKIMDTTNNQSAILYADMESNINIDNLDIVDCYSQIFILRSSTAIIKNVYMELIKATFQLMRVEKAINTHFENW